MIVPNPGAKVTFRRMPQAGEKRYLVRSPLFPSSSSGIWVRPPAWKPVLPLA